MGTTDVSVIIRIIDSGDGTPETGVEHNTSGIDLEYRREGAASTDITEAALSALTDAHSDGGIEHIGNGYYRLDLPDAACASGATGVLVHGTITGMIVIGTYIELVAYDPYDAVRLGLTALPNAAADAAGGLPVSDAGGLDLDAQIGTDIDNLVTRLGTPSDLGSGASVAANLVDIEGQTDDIGVAGAGLTAINLPDQTMNITGNITGNLSGSVGSVTGAVGSVTGNVGGNVTGSVGSLATQAKADVNAEVDSALADARLDELLAADSDIDGAAPPTVGSVFHELMSKTTGSFTYDQTTDSNEAIKDAITTPPTAEAIADQVWEETLADHSGTSGSTAEALNAAGAAGDPWMTALPGAYGAGSAGNILGNRLVGTLATGTHNPQSGDAYARLGAPAGASVSADVAAVKSETAAIVADTGTDGVVVAAGSKTGYALSSTGIQAIWDALTSALTTASSIGKLLVDNINATISSRSSHSAADVWSSGTRTLTAGTNITLAKGTGVTGFNDLSASDVNAEVVDALATDTYAEPTGTPAATITLASKIGWLFMALRNRLDITATKKTFYDDGGAAEWEKDLSDDGTTYSESEGNAP